MDRNARNVLHQRQTRIGRQAKATQAVEFFNVLTSPELLATTEALLPEHRERLYPPTVALSMFMRQVLEADDSCQKAVNGWAAQRAADGLSPCSVRTGGYCRARQRLPLERVSTLTRETGRLAQPEGAGTMALARAFGQAGGRYRDIDARCPVLQLFPDRHPHGRRRGRIVRAKRLANHRLSPW
jgi:hypothetical protein